jgi:hypothetical protein
MNNKKKKCWGRAKGQFELKKGIQAFFVPFKEGLRMLLDLSLEVIRG